MKVILPGGTGQIGRILSRAYAERGHEVVVLSRSGRVAPSSATLPGVRAVGWDGSALDAWSRELDGADVVVNLAGRSVSCRYTEANLRQMMASRVESARVIGLAIAQATTPPRLWLQMSTATIYAHTLGPAHDEATGTIGGDEPDVPAYWRRSIEIATAWEEALAAAEVSDTRKVALRAAMVMSPDRGGVFDVLSRLVRLRLGGAVAGGGQYVSWIHHRDLVRALDLLIEHDDIDGPVNICAPNPLPQRDLMAGLRAAWGVRIGLPATKAMAELGALVMRSDTELLLKSRRVLPGRLLDAGFEFEFPDWPTAATDLVGHARNQSSPRLAG